MLASKHTCVISAKTPTDMLCNTARAHNRTSKACEQSCDIYTHAHTLTSTFCGCWRTEKKTAPGTQNPILPYKGLKACSKAWLCRNGAPKAVPFFGPDFGTGRKETIVLSLVAAQKQGPKYGPTCGAPFVATNAAPGPKKSWPRVPNLHPGPVAGAIPAVAHARGRLELAHPL